MSPNAAQDVPPFLLTEGGPGAVLLRTLRLAPIAPGSRREALVLAGVAWVPLLVLSLSEGLATGGVPIPFLRDIAAHVRFLFALPVLVLAEIPIGRRLRQVTAHFIVSGLVRREQHERFAKIIVDAVRFRDSRVAELVVLAAAYMTAVGVLTRITTQQGDIWFSPHEGEISRSGYWYVLVSIPIVQFLVYRWIYRMVVWTRFLAKVQSLDLELTPTHPDGAGGLGFLGAACVPFGLLLFAMSAVVSSQIANRILFTGAKLEQYQFSYAALFVLALAIFGSPLLVFVPKLAKLKREARLEYDTFATQYTQLFARKWIDPGTPGESPLGSGDIQSLADLGTSYERVKNVRLVPVQLGDFIGMVVPGLIPVLPLVATVMPVSEIVKGLLHLLT
ncbi:MAG TPA: hypothetical protein VMS22_20695 [Candidatus Eisenbacteria bacterium]|nr:hypothetical protein [Candidatus Eisenbacteria bacterium]